MFSWTNSLDSKDEKSIPVKRTRRCQRFDKNSSQMRLGGDLNFEQVMFSYIRPISIFKARLGGEFCLCDVSCIRAIYICRFLQKALN